MNPEHPHRREYDARLDEIELKLDKLTKDVEQLVAAWNAASWLVSAIKYLGGIATALSAVYALIKLKG